MKLIHYTSEPFPLEPRKYNQDDLSWHAKPNGLWVSVEGEYDWKWWCEAEEYNLVRLVVSYDVVLKEDANILHLKTPEEIHAFGRSHLLKTRKWDDCTHQLEWSEVKSKYQGIIISPYQWACRLSEESNWYYGWDCASGCIWDLDCIKEFKLMENNNVNYCS